MKNFIKYGHCFQQISISGRSGILAKMQAKTTECLYYFVTED